MIIKNINKLLEKTEGRLDLPEMFTEEALKIKTCFGLIVEILYLIFGWSGFQHSSNLEVSCRNVYDNGYSQKLS